MKVLYTCGTCAIVDREVDVVDREPGEDIVRWMETRVGHALGHDHATESPRCTAREMKYLKIPVPPGTDSIGVPVKH